MKTDLPYRKAIPLQGAAVCNRRPTKSAISNRRSLGLTSERRRPRTLLRDANVLRLGEEAEGFVAAFAADAALFHAAERDPKVADEPAVYPDSSGVDFFGDAMGAT